jgi:hypothetical protein
VRSNIVDELCARLGLGRRGRYTKLGELFGVSRQHIHGWRRRNKLPESQYRRARELTGMDYGEFLPESSRVERVPMIEFLADVTRYVELARAGTTVELTVNGNAIVRLSPAQVRT